MSDLCHRIFNEFRTATGPGNLRHDRWYVVSGKGGPNAVLKLVIPSCNGDRGYVLTVARQPETVVVRHEVEILERLRQTLPGSLSSTIPTVAGSGTVENRSYFAVPLYPSFGRQRVIHRLGRTRRIQWVINWVTELARHTRGPGLSVGWLEAQYAGPLDRIAADAAVSDDVKRQLRESFQTVLSRADEIPSVCCHGDLWAENILWQRNFGGAIVLDWGSAQWPGLPGMDLCRYAMSCLKSDLHISEAIGQYCRTIDLKPTLIPPLYDLYNVFIKAELDLAYATQPHLQFDPFTGATSAPSQRLSSLISAR